MSERRRDDDPISRGGPWLLLVDVLALFLIALAAGLLIYAVMGPDQGVRSRSGPSTAANRPASSPREVAA